MQIGIVKFIGGPYATNAYLVGCKQTQKAAVIDPAMGSSSRLIEGAKERGWTLEKILLTHSHWDHFVDAKALQKELGLPLYVHARDRENVEHPGSDAVESPVPIEAAQVEGVFADGDRISVGTLEFEVIHTPGHCLGAVCFYEASQGVLFSGDTLFRGSMGAVALPTAEPEKMWVSLKRLAALPPETRVYPGHGGETTIGREDWMARAQEYFGG